MKLLSWVKSIFQPEPTFKFKYNVAISIKGVKHYKCLSPETAWVKNKSEAYAFTPMELEKVIGTDTHTIDGFKFVLEVAD